MLDNQPFVAFQCFQWRRKALLIHNYPLISSLSIFCICCVMRKLFDLYPTTSKIVMKPFAGDTNNLYTADFHCVKGAN